MAECEVERGSEDVVCEGLQEFQHTVPLYSTVCAL